jgi:hypothetical protein
MRTVPHRCIPCGRAGSRITRGAGGGGSQVTRTRGHATVTTAGAVPGAAMRMSAGRRSATATTRHRSTHGGVAVTGATLIIGAVLDPA